MFFAFEARADTFPPPGTLSEQLQRAEAVGEYEVLRVVTELNENSVVVSHVDLVAVGAPIKGIHTRATVTLAGGVLDGVVRESESAPIVHEGERWLLILSRNEYGDLSIVNPEASMYFRESDGTVSTTRHMSLTALSCDGRPATSADTWTILSSRAELDLPMDDVVEPAPLRWEDALDAFAMCGSAR